MSDMFVVESLSLAALIVVVAMSPSFVLARFTRDPADLRTAVTALIGSMTTALLCVGCAASAAATAPNAGLFVGFLALVWGLTWLILGVTGLSVWLFTATAAIKQMRSCGPVPFRFIVAMSLVLGVPGLALLLYIVSGLSRMG